MTTKELIEKLKEFDSETEVTISCWNSLQIRQVRFIEEKNVIFSSARKEYTIDSPFQEERYKKIVIISG